MSRRGCAKSTQKHGNTRQSKKRRGSSMPGAEPSSELEVVQLLGLNDDAATFDAGDSSHNSTGNKINASGPSQS